MELLTKGSDQPPAKSALSALNETRQKKASAVAAKNKSRPPGRVMKNLPGQLVFKTGDVHTIHSLQAQMCDANNIWRLGAEVCQDYFDRYSSCATQPCPFSHGIAEIRPKPFDSRYKTTFCQFFHSSGKCGFGTLCKFIHDEYRTKPNEGEYWLICPTEKLIRIEIVENQVDCIHTIQNIESCIQPISACQNTPRKRLLDALIQFGPQKSTVKFSKPLRLSLAPNAQFPHYFIGGQSDEPASRYQTPQGLHVAKPDPTFESPRVSSKHFAGQFG